MSKEADELNELITYIADCYKSKEKALDQFNTKRKHYLSNLKEVENYQVHKEILEYDNTKFEKEQSERDYKRWFIIYTGKFLIGLGCFIALIKWI